MDADAHERGSFAPVAKMLPHVTDVAMLPLSPTRASLYAGLIEGRLVRAGWSAILLTPRGPRENRDDKTLDVPPRPPPPHRRAAYSDARVGLNGSMATSVTC